MFKNLSASAIAAIYLVVAGLWIAFTDSLLNTLITDPDLLTTIQTYKGLVYVIVTTVGLYLLITKHDSLVAEQMEEHRAERELLEKLFDQIPVMINAYNPNQNRFRINKEFERITGWNSDEVQDTDLTKACFPDPELRKEVKEFMDTPNSGWRKFSMTTKSGEQRQTLWTNIHLKDDTLVGIGLDITERKKNEQILKFQQQKLDRAQQLAGLGYWEFDLKTKELSWSDGLYKIHPLPPGTSPTVEQFKEYVHPEDRAEFEQFIPSIIEHGKKEVAIRAQDADANMGHFFSSGELLTNEAGEPTKVFGIVINITDVKKSELKAKKSERLLRKTFDSLHSSIFVVDPETRTIIDCNKHTEEIFGYSKQELIGSSTRFLHVDEEHYLQFDKEGFKELKENGVFNTEYKMKRKNGEIFHSDHTVSLVFDENGEVDRVVSVVRDITERKQYEQQLRRSKERLHRAQKVGQVGDWIFELASGKVSWSPMVYEIYGRDPELGPPSLEELEAKYYPEDFELHHSKVFNAIENATSYDIDLKLKADDSKDKYVRAIGIPVQDETGNVTKLLGTVQDITERKRAEQRLRESEQKYRLLFQHNPQPMWIYNPRTLQFVEVNQAAIDHYGYSEEEFKQMTLMDIRPGDQKNKLEENIRQNTGTSAYGEEWTHLKKDGSQIIVSISSSPIDFLGKNYRLVVAKDITEQKKAEKQVLNSLIEGEERERKRIAKELHDGLGQYLSASNMNFEAIKTDLKDLSDKRVQQFRTGLNLLQNAIKETRNIAHNLMPAAIEDYGLELAVESLMEQLSKGSDIQFRFKSELSDIQLKQQTQINLYRVIQEALSNAVKYAECHKIDVQLYRHDHIISCMIEDDGIGTKIDAEAEDQGMGIRSMKTRIHALSGTIDFESTKGTGMNILVQLPLQPNIIQE